MPGVATAHSLPPGYAVRHPRPEDLPAVQLLLNECESFDTGEPCAHDMDIAAEAQGSKLDLERHMWLATAPGGEPIGVAWLWAPDEARREIAADQYVHPEHRATTVDDVLTDLVEARVAEFVAGGGAPQAEALVFFADVNQAARCASLRARGFSVVTTFNAMRIDLDRTQPWDDAPVEWPAGIVVRPIEPERDGREAHAAEREAFSEHYLNYSEEFDEWRAKHFERYRFDPSLWLVAWDGDRIAGQVVARPLDRETYIDGLSVGKPWRGRGLGRALLVEEFRLLAARGHTLVRLFVHADNATGAQHVYERAGMRVERRFDVYERRLERADPTGA